MTLVYVYGKAQLSLWQGLIDFENDDVKAMLLASYTIGTTLDDAQFLDEVLDAATEADGDGYTAGGQDLSGKSAAYTAADSWGTARANNTAYAAGDVVRPNTGNGYVYQAVVGGTSAGSAPTWPTTIGATVTDGGVTWACAGRGVLKIDATDPQWTTTNPGELSAAYVLFYVDKEGDPETSPVLVLWDLEGTETASNGGTFTPTLDAGEGLFVMFTG